jgi:pimeloyl-ACP methyl ester carboxylesterase
VARFVFVHGAFGGAWTWEPVMGPLEALSHTVEALDLPGSGEDRTAVEEVTLESYAARVCDALAQRHEPAVLVGHSMGGVVVTQAAGDCPEHVASLIFVTAFMPADGQSLLDLTRLPEGADDMIQANLVVEGDPPVGMLSEEAATKAVFNRCTPEQAAVAVAAARRRPQPLAPLADAVRVDDALLGSIPRSYVLTTDDNSIPPALQRRMVGEHPCRIVVELDTDHAPQLSATDELVATLDRIARETG